MKWIAYGNIDLSGWKKLLETSNYQEILDFIDEVYLLDERCEVIIKYQDRYMENILCSFSNRTTSKRFLELRLERKKL